MAKKKRKSGSGRSSNGHFCKVCGEHKANEKFSGKGHAAHICKKCSSLPLDERNEMMANRRIEGMAFRHLSESEMKWLRNHMNDPRPAVRKAAAEAHSIKFPHYERNMAKKGMTVFSLELYIHATIYDGWGGEADVHARVFAGDTGEFRYVDYNMPEGERELTAHIDKKDARRFLKAVVHELDAPFWDEDFNDTEYKHDPYLDIFPEYRPDFDDYEEDEDEEEEESTSSAPVDENREPLWSLRLELNTRVEKVITFYTAMPDRPVDLFWSLMEYFEPEEDDEYSDDEDNDLTEE